MLFLAAAGWYSKTLHLPIYCIYCCTLWLIIVQRSWMLWYRASHLQAQLVLICSKVLLQAPPEVRVFIVKVVLMLLLCVMLMAAITLLKNSMRPSHCRYR
jgi:hypothetical protein